MILLNKFILLIRKNKYFVIFLYEYGFQKTKIVQMKIGQFSKLGKILKLV